jgi:hypothetical protein
VLQVLNLSVNKLDTQSIDRLEHALRGNHTLSSLHLHGVNQRVPSSVITLAVLYQ